MRFFYLVLPCLMAFASLSGQQVPFQRGVNLTGWFQASNARRIQFSLYSKTDFAQIKSLGCDVIRLPINLHAMTDGAPHYRVDPLLFAFLDSVVAWAEELELHLILDNHTFDPSTNTEAHIGVPLKAIWPQLAAHFNNRSNRLYYEILNEPHGIADALWNQIQGEVIQAIRAVDTAHTIIVGPANWNSYQSLTAMPAYSDPRLIYTFHFYDPFLFTHQGASWTAPSLVPLGGIPFPYGAASMPALPAALRGTWIESGFQSYAREGTAARVREQLDIAIQFRNQRNVPVFCGEFGVYQPNSTPLHRQAWYRIVREYLEANGIPWTSWDYHGGFGVFLPGTAGLFDRHLDVPLLESMGLQAPPQLPDVFAPDSAGFFLYRDFIESGLLESSYGSGTLDYYDQTNSPLEGNYAIRWDGPGQYSSIGFAFRQTRDLSVLRAQGYGVGFWVKGNSPGASFDIRFIDTKTGANDLPWRMRFTVSETQAPWDGRWRHIHVPLTAFQEHGAWDNGWFNPQGKFDWKSIARFEIVAEHGGLESARFSFDQIQISLPQAVAVRQPSPTLAFEVFPNPASDRINVRLSSRPGNLDFVLTDLSGKLVRQGMLEPSSDIPVQGLPSGTYFLRITDERGSWGSRKVVIW
ncbi:MAG: cellulase family glycosylhydrolase [Haliscomenobacter sp.]|nr:cellulase family glycosylhydrolase [Haliscomenobacter sp.]